MMAALRTQAGFTYLMVLFTVAIMGSSLALVGTLWHTAAKRDKEAELLYAGNQYRLAIGRYFMNGPRQYPRELSDLLKDQRRPVLARYLRKLYPDPITGSQEWGIVKAPGGGIMGVYSRSKERPIKTTGFDRRDEGFENAETYADWKFVHEAQVVMPGPARGAPTLLFNPPPSR